MVEMTLAFGDLLRTPVNLFYQAQWPLTLIAIGAGSASAVVALPKGLGKAAGRMVGGILIGAAILGGPSLTRSVNYTVNTHGGAGPVMLDTGWSY
jgi:hypothetical protein